MSVTISRQQMAGSSTGGLDDLPVRRDRGSVKASFAFESHLPGVEGTLGNTREAFKKQGTRNYEIFNLIF